MKKITMIFCILPLILSIAVVGVFAEQSQSDKILQEIEMGGKSTAEKKQLIIDALLAGNGDQPMSTQDAMRLQMQLMQLNLQTEQTSNVADKFSQGAPTPFKNQ